MKIVYLYGLNIEMLQVFGGHVLLFVEKGGNAILFHPFDEKMFLYIAASAPRLSVQCSVGNECVFGTDEVILPPPPPPPAQSL